MTSDSRTDLDVIKDMIAISAERLEGLRTQCATSASLTQQEIRSLETKLVRMFCDLLLAKERLNERIPASGLPHTTGSELKQWLSVVGLSQDTLAACLTSISTLEQLLEQNDDELRRLVSNNPNYREEEVRRLTKAMQNLRKCKEFLSSDGDCDSDLSLEQENKEHLLDNLFWDSWDRHHHHRGSVGYIGIMSSPRTQRVLMKQARQFGSSGLQSPLNNDNSCSNIDDLTSLPGSTLTPTLTPSPPGSPYPMSHPGPFFNHAITVGGGSLNGTPIRTKPAGTPPPIKKHQTLLSNCNQSLTPTHCISISTNSQSALDKTILPLTKSNELQFQDPAAHSPPSLKSEPTTRSLVCADPTAANYSTESSDTFVETGNNNNLQVPRSPCASTYQSYILPSGMSHAITHRFTKVLKVIACDLCQKQMFFGLKCKECKYFCHKDCGPHAPASCGLPPQFVDAFKKSLQDTGGFYNLNLQRPSSQSVRTTSPNLNTLERNRAARRLHKSNQATNFESSSPASSCNSSTPSSPALFNMQQQQQQQQQMSLISSATYSGSIINCIPGIACGTNIMSSSCGGSSSASSNMLSTPSSFHKNSSQFNFPDVTVTPNCYPLDSNATHTLYSSQSSNNDLESITSPQECKETNNTTASTLKSNAVDAEHRVTNTTSATADAVAGYNSLTCSINSTALSNPSRTGNNSVTMSIVSTDSGTFYPRKLSSAGVDKRAPLSELTDTHKSNDSDKTGSIAESTDSDRTPVRLDSTEDTDSIQWPRQNSLSAKEWDIPYGDLDILDVIGIGRFGVVHRAMWHGPVAVKLLKEDYLRDEHMLEAFRLEVANFKKTRHENLVLFMGACMSPPHLAIVTSLCKGNTLHTYIHTRRDKFTINKTTLVAQQISQGMGYLHARGIVHKDLRTKNIFLENGKVIITDFGLFSSTKLDYCDRGLCVPKGCLCYMSPELMRALLPIKPSEEVLPFSRASDVYSFGTVWYELLCGEFPFRLQPPISTIWQVGRGMKQTLANIHTTRDVKDILMLCWSYHADDRPDFQRLTNLLEKLPKKRLARSPSHPVQFTSRSAESVF